MPDTLYVLAASYDDVEDALASYQAIDVAWRHVSSSHDFDAAVVAKDDDGKVQIVRRHDEPTRHGTSSGPAGASPWAPSPRCSRPWGSSAPSPSARDQEPRWARSPGTPPAP